MLDKADAPLIHESYPLAVAYTALLDAVKSVTIAVEDLPLPSTNIHCETVTPGMCVICVCLSVCLSVCLCTYTCVCMCMSVCLLVYVCVCLLHCVSMCVCCVCICILACFLYIYVVYTLNTHGVHACLSIIVHALYHALYHASHANIPSNCILFSSFRRSE